MGTCVHTHRHTHTDTHTHTHYHTHTLPHTHTHTRTHTEVCGVLHVVNSYYMCALYVRILSRSVMVGMLIVVSDNCTVCVLQVRRRIVALPSSFRASWSTRRPSPKPKLTLTLCCKSCLQTENCAKSQSTGHRPGSVCVFWGGGGVAVYVELGIVCCVNVL